MPDQLACLEEMSARIPAAKQHQALGEALNLAAQAAGAAAESIARLENVNGFIPLVIHHLSPTDREQLRRWLVSFQSIGNRLAQASDTDGLAAGARELNQELPLAVARAEELIHRGWRTKMDQEFASIGQLCGVLRQIPETEQLGIEISSLMHRVEQLRHGSAVAAQCAVEFAKLQRQRNTAINNLAGLGAGDTVVHFLIAVASSSATLAHVKPEVRDWLDARNALELFKVKL